MAKHKTPRQKGKLSLSRYFQEFKAGDSVAVVRELSIPFSYSTRLQGRTGKIIEKKGNSYYVQIKDLNKPKKYFIKAIHLKKIQESA